MLRDRSDGIPAASGVGSVVGTWLPGQSGVPRVPVYPVRSPPVQARPLAGTVSSVLYCDWRIDIPCVGPSEIKLYMTKRWKCALRHTVIAYNVIWGNQKTEYSVYRWLRALAMFDVTRFPTFVGASGIITICRYFNMFIMYIYCDFSLISNFWPVTRSLSNYVRSGCRSNRFDS